MNAPPLLISFSSVEDYFKALPLELRAHDDDFRRLVAMQLPPVVSLRCLAVLFGYSPKFVGAMYSRSERYYRTFSIPKGKKIRTIHAPKVSLKVIQKWFGFHLAKVADVSRVAYGFVESKSAVKAAKIHCGARWVYSVDIQDFFPSTQCETVRSALIGLGYPPHGAELITKLCSYNGALAQGSPASPVLSNIVFQPIDRKLEALANGLKISVTRYADDIVFSGHSSFPEELRKDVRSLIESGGWKVAENKEYFAERPNRLKVHGLLVHGRKPRLTRGYRNKIRAFSHLLRQEKVRSEDIPRLQGHLSYARSVDLS